MLKNYIVIALRTLLRYKIASLISVAGLALGMACALLIFLFVQFEISFDRFHKNRDRIVRLSNCPGSFEICHGAGHDG